MPGRLGAVEAVAMILHVTNGDHAAVALAKAGITGRILPWRDVLHEGPVPHGKTLRQMSRIRARFISSPWPGLGDVARSFEKRDRILADFGRYGETVLWFEHDLYDQLQLIQILDWFSGRRAGLETLRIVIAGNYIGQGLDLKAAFERREPVTAARIRLARAAWSAFTSPEPRKILKIAILKTPGLPYLAPALMRHLRQFPSAENGLNLTERRILGAVASGARRPRALFKACQELEDPKFMGDAVFWIYLAGLVNGRRPLLGTKARGGFLPPERFDNAADFNKQTIFPTETGVRVMNNEADWVALNGIDKWLGGVHLKKGNVWRWKESERRITKERPRFRLR